MTGGNMGRRTFLQRVSAAVACAFGSIGALFGAGCSKIGHERLYGPPEVVYGPPEMFEQDPVEGLYGPPEPVYGPPYPDEPGSGEGDSPEESDEEDPYANFVEVYGPPPESR